MGDVSEAAIQFICNAYTGNDCSVVNKLNRNTYYDLVKGENLTQYNNLMSEAGSVNITSSNPGAWVDMVNKIRTVVPKGSKHDQLVNHEDMTKLLQNPSATKRFIGEFVVINTTRYLAEKMDGVAPTALKLTELVKGAAFGKYGALTLTANLDARMSQSQRLANRVVSGYDTLDKNQKSLGRLLQEARDREVREKNARRVWTGAVALMTASLAGQVVMLSLLGAGMLSDTVVYSACGVSAFGAAVFEGVLRLVYR
jgi:hypothetical protein